MNEEKLSLLDELCERICDSLPMNDWTFEESNKYFNGLYHGVCVSVFSLCFLLSLRVFYPDETVK